MTYRKHSIISTLILLLLSQLLSAQVITIKDTKYFGGNRKITGLSKAIATRDKGYTILAITNDSGSLDIPPYPIASPGEYSLLLKLDSNFNKQWVNVWGSPDLGGAIDICQTRDGGYGVCFTVPGSNMGDMRLAKLDSLGTVQWIKLYGSSGQDIPLSVIESSDGGFLLAGVSMGRDGDIPYNYTPPTLFPPSDWVIIKVDSLGNKQWVKVLGTSGDERWGMSLKQFGSYYYFASSTKSKDHDCVDTVGRGGYTGLSVYVFKIDTAGNTVWAKAYGGGDVIDMIVDEEDSTLVIGGDTGGGKFEFPAGNGSIDMYVMKIKLDNTFVWAQTLGGVSYEESRSLCKGKNKSYYAVADIRLNTPPQIGEEDCWLFWIDSSGNRLKSKVYGGVRSDYVHTVLPNRSGEPILFGNSRSPNFTEGTGTNILSLNPMIGYNGIYVSQVSAWGLGISPITLPSQQIKVAPNPANNSVAIVWGKQWAVSHIYLLSIDGTKVLSIVPEANRHSITLNTASLSSGVYTVVVQGKDQKQVAQKLVLQ